MAIIDRIRQGAGRAAHNISEYNRVRQEIHRLKVEKKTTLGEIERVYNQIGHAYIEADGRPSEALSALSCRVAELRAKVDELQSRILAVQNQRHCPNCGTIMPMDSLFCPHCGQKLPELKPETETDAEPSDRTIWSIGDEEEVDVERDYADSENTLRLDEIEEVEPLPDEESDEAVAVE